MVRQGAAATDLVVSEQAAKVASLARQLRYEGSTAPDVLENSAREAIRRIGMGIFELGGYLLLLREACPHGQFLPTLERLGLEPRVAQQYMKVTRRFANANSSSHLESVGVKKLAELVVLDDDQVDDLLTLGQTGELSLDDVATMSVKELRSAVRELRQDKTAVEEVVGSLRARARAATPPGAWAMAGRLPARAGASPPPAVFWVAPRSAPCARGRERRFRLPHKPREVGSLRARARA